MLKSREALLENKQGGKTPYAAPVYEVREIRR